MQCRACKNTNMQLVTADHFNDGNLAFFLIAAKCLACGAGLIFLVEDIGQSTEQLEALVNAPLPDNTDANISHEDNVLDI